MMISGQDGFSIGYLMNRDESPPPQTIPEAHSEIIPNPSKILDLMFPFDSETQISICLKVDAKDGCGGHAWPAGEVH
jgi:hypothetical protein